MSAIGTKQTCLFALHMSAFDPKRTSRNLRRCQCLHLNEPGYRPPAPALGLTQGGYDGVSPRVRNVN